MNSPDLIPLLKTLIVTLNMIIVYEVFYNPPEDIHPFGRQMMLGSGIFTIILILFPVLVQAMTL